MSTINSSLLANTTVACTQVEFDAMQSDGWHTTIESNTPFSTALQQSEAAGRGMHGVQVRFLRVMDVNTRPYRMLEKPKIH